MNVSTRIASAWKKSTLLLGLSLCAVFSAAAAETAPVLKDNSIEIAGKTVTLQPNGLFSCKNQQGVEILRCPAPYFWLVKDKQNLWGWKDKNFDQSKSKFTREGNKYTWELWYGNPADGIQPAKFVVQTLELLPDGTFELTYTNEIPAESNAGKFKLWTQTLMLPFAAWLNESWTNSKGNQVLTAEIKTASEYEKGGLLKWTFAADKPEKRITFMVKKNPNRQLVLMPRKDTKYYQLYTEGAITQHKKAVIYIDFR